ncbi:MAG TPA: hypothetical protein VGV39_17625 [Mesorhizobium sp.]|jgi:hypothetical protein|uniref:hypothetical protein n=1 Tax=Mesorhizobium sp. TaxID=1871066 RepID=UPI002DDCFCE5|nr:hypothetical protein [Mesorhizobium sp.]HEV2504900.1 hypothetical protein [Mesorhizobium sp.]
MKRYALWLLAIFAILMAALSGLLFLSPSARLVTGIFIAGLSDPGPPPIAQGVITESDWPHFEAASIKLTKVLETKFPAGSKEDFLKSTLTDQHFRTVDPPPSDCIPPDQPVPAGVVSYQCLTSKQEEERKRTLVYKWGGGFCVNTISVVWSSDETNALTHVEGSYYGRCL